MFIDVVPQLLRQDKLTTLRCLLVSDEAGNNLLSPQCRDVSFYVSNDLGEAVCYAQLCKPDVICVQHRLVTTNTRDQLVYFAGMQNASCLILLVQSATMVGSLCYLKSVCDAILPQSWLAPHVLCHIHQQTHKGRGTDATPKGVKP